MKRGPLNILYRAAGHLVINIEGIRAEESAKRKDRPAISIRKGITSTEFEGMTVEDALDKWVSLPIQQGLFENKSKPRLAIDWLPIHAWTEAQVYEACGHSLEEVEWRRALSRERRYEEALADWHMHPAYALGARRMSCAICILSPASDIAIGALHNQELYQTYRNMEISSGYTFKHKWSLAEAEV